MYLARQGPKSFATDLSVASHYPQL
jgi:hypothetical protein